MKSTMDGLNPNQRAFCIEYLKDFNATQAAIRAGYSERTAGQQGSRLLSHVKIKENLREMVEEALEQDIPEVKAKIVSELKKIASFDVTEFVTIDGGVITIRDTSGHDCSPISGIKQTESGIEVKFHDKLKALEMLGRYTRLFVDRIEHSGEIHAHFDDAERDV